MCVCAGQDDYGALASFGWWRKAMGSDAAHWRVSVWPRPFCYTGIYTHNPTCVQLLTYCNLLNMVWLYAFLHLAILVWISFYMSLSVSEAESRFGQIDSCQSATRSSCCSLHLEWTCRFPAQVRWWHGSWEYNHKDADDEKCHGKNYDHV